VNVEDALGHEKKDAFSLDFEEIVSAGQQGDLRRKLKAKKIEEKPLQSAESTITVYLNEELSAKYESSNGDLVSFPLAVDDYFMAVAVLSRRLSAEHEKDLKQSVGACIASNQSLHVVSIGYNIEGGGDYIKHAELHALVNAQQSREDLTKCSVYTTSPPCFQCTQAILQAGIRVVVHGGVCESLVKKLVYREKACFKEYQCYDKNKKFIIKVKSSDADSDTKEKPPGTDSREDKNKEDDPQLEPAPSTNRQKPSYEDFFMAMAFLSSMRTKDRKYYVGACLVTPPPHRLVALGYNRMPDGRGFKDENMPWGPHQRKYICHAEVNAIIAGFRREADLSACTLYVTYSPCIDCSKLVAQSGIKNVVFAKYYNCGRGMKETLRRLTDTTLTQYKYMSSSGENNIAKMTINLTELTVQLEKSEAPPKLGPPDIEKKGGPRQVALPLDDYFMAIAVLAKSRSPFLDNQEKSVCAVGACLVNQDLRRAISVGYNGYINSLSDGFVCCAEFNTIVSAFRYHADLTRCILYTTGIPCARCATKIVQSGLKTVVHGKGEMEEEAKKIFYWGKVATLEYDKVTTKPFIEIDLHGLTIDQTEDKKAERPLNNTVDKEPSSA
jgi:dCMP deaminase